MAKTDANNRKKAVEDGTPENLDKVRDILFGGQMRTVETRLRGLEERIHKEQEAMRAEFAKRVAELDAIVRKENQALHERVATENDARVSALKTLAAEIRESHKAMDKRHAKLEDATSVSDAELRDHLIAQSKAASAELARVHDQLTAALAKSHDHLASTKTDRAALAALLTNIATKLGDGPAKGAAKG